MPESKLEPIDYLSRKPFAEMLAQAIMATPADSSSVFAICGGWGTGKTWTAQRIVEALADRTTVLRFEPWMVSSTEALTREFFLDLARGVLKKGNDTEEIVKREQFWRYAAQVIEITSNLSSALATLGVPAVGLVGEASKQIKAPIKAVAEGLKVMSEKPSLREARDSIVQQLASLDPPILMVIDDIDRLTDEEIRTLFRIIKACADFPNVRYLLLFQRTQVERALNKLTDDGSHFLEKIVTVTIDLPVIRNADRQAVLERLIEPITVHAQEADARQRVQDVVETILMPGLPTLRNVERYATSAVTLARALEDETVASYDPADFLTLEFLRIKAPHVYAEMTAPGDVRQNPFETYLANEKGEKPSWAKKIEEALSEDSQQPLASKAFEILRPDLDLNTGKPKSMSRPAKGWGKRFFIEAWRPVYTGMDPAHAALGESEWSTFKDQLEDPKKPVAVPVGLIDKVRKSRVISIIRDRIQELSEQALCKLLSNLIEWAEDKNVMVDERWDSNQALSDGDLAYIAESVLVELDVKEVATRCLEKALLRDGSLTLGAVVISTEYSASYRSGSGYWSSEEELEPLASDWRNRLTKMVEDKSMYSHPKARTLLFAWQRLIDEKIWEAFRERVFNDPIELSLYVESFWSIPDSSESVSFIDIRNPDRKALINLDPRYLGPRGRAIQASYIAAQEAYEKAERLTRRKRLF